MTSVVAQMLPSQSQSNGKRKVQDDNPLLNAAKRAKKEGQAGASTKRKLLNAEEQPGGLLIVKGPSVPRLSSAPPNSQPSRKLSQPQRPPSSAGAGPSKPPSKKFRADSQPPAPPRSRDRGAISTSQDDTDIEKDVRAMEDEADHLRRNSRAHTTIDPSLTASLNPEFQFPSRPPDPGSSRKGKTKITDTSVPLPSEETPQIQRNKLLRGDAMAAIGNGRPEKSNGGGHRRKSSINSRGKRISSSFESTGIITHPHNSVSESSFYKHIDCDLPDAERLRQLLIWCSLRAASNSTDSSDNPEPLPPLSADNTQFLKSVQDDVVRMLAEKKVDLSLYPPEASTRSTMEPQKENDQNVTNRGWEIKYGENIQRAMEEDEAWKKVGYAYDAYAKKTRTALEKQASAMAARSANAKGKQRATNDDADWMPRDHELSDRFRWGVELVRSVLGTHAVGDDRMVGYSQQSTLGLLKNAELEAEVSKRISEIEFKLDHLRVLSSTARTTTNIAEQALDQRFELLSTNLMARSNPPATISDPSSSSGVLSTYVAREVTGPDPMALMRALSRVDKDRPPAMVGDAARRAAREVQRVGESGVSALGERRLTGVPPPNPSQTPRKVPGTPRRGGTPARDRER